MMDLALGAISVGIALCDGIVTYVDHWKGQDAEVKSVRDAAQSLAGLLREVDSRLQSQPTLVSSLKDSLNACIGTCNSSIDSISKLSDKYTPPSGSRTELQYQLRKIIFPFKRDTLIQLQHRLDIFHRNLNTAVQLLGLDISLQQQSAISEVSSKLEAAIVRRTVSLEEKTTTGIVTTREQLGGEIQGLNHNIATLLQGLEARQKRQSQEMQRFRDSMEYELKLLQIISPSNSSIEQPTSSTRSLGPEVQLLTTRRRRKLQNNAPNFPRHPCCTCDMKKIASCSSSCWGSSIFRLTSNICSIHDKGCIVSFTSRGNRTDKFIVGIGRFRVTGSVDVEYSPFSWITSVRLKALHLNFRATVPNDAPAFKTLHDFLTAYIPWQHPVNTTTPFEDMKQAEDCAKRIHALFQSGKASPRDVTSDGWNLLHIITFLAAYYREQMLEKQAGLILLLKYLTETGVSWCELDTSNQSPFSFLISHPPSVGDREGYDTICWAVEAAQISPTEKPFLYHPTFSWLQIVQNCYQFQRAPRLTRNAALLEALQYGPLSISVLNKDLPSLKYYLAVTNATRRSRRIEERNYLGQGPLHLASDWPEGLEVLLLSASVCEINAGDIFGFTALDHALLHGHLDSAALLQRSGAILGKHWVYGFHDAMEILAQVPSRSLRFAFRTLRIYRDVLRDLALNHLSAEIIDFYRLSPDRVLDLHTDEICEKLHDAGVRISRQVRALNVYDGSVYHHHQIHSNNDSYRVIKSLYEAGFHDVDAAWKGLTPMMKWEYNTNLGVKNVLRTINLLILFGADLTRELPVELMKQDGPGAVCLEGKCLAVHMVASGIGLMFPRNTRDHDPASWRPVESEPLVLTVEKILLGSYKDASNCGCSLSGGTPFSVGFRATSRNYRPRPADQPPGLRGLERLDWFCTLLREESLAKMMLEPVLRIITFEALELKHTCCTYNNMYMLELPHYWLVQSPSQDEIEEIHDEERESLQQLDELVAEFIAEFEKCGMSLLEFVNGYWRERMAAILQPNPDDWDQEELERVLELGVRIEKDKKEDGADGD